MVFLLALWISGIARPCPIFPAMNSILLDAESCSSLSRVKLMLAIPKLSKTRSHVDIH